MKFKEVLQKMINKGNQLGKAKKPLIPLVVSLTQKSFNELQTDIIVNHTDLASEHMLKDTSDPKVFTLRNPAAGISAEVHIK